MRRRGSVDATTLIAQPSHRKDVTMHSGPSATQRDDLGSTTPMIRLFAALGMILSLGAVPATSLAMEDAKPPCADGCQGGGGGWGGVPGPGPGDPSLGGTGMPHGGDASKVAEADRKDKEAERKKKPPPQQPPVYAKTLGRVTPASEAPRGTKSICDAAREARARNSPAAPNLEAQCHH
jgi:hypothetical protein